MCDYYNYTDLQKYSNSYNRKVYTPEYTIYTHQRFSYFTLNGYKHNVKGPASITYYENGNIWSKRYVINGKLHNTRGPATITYFENGIVQRDVYWENGLIHNNDGHAIIHYEQTGEFHSGYYYIKGKRKSEI